MLPDCGELDGHQWSVGDEVERASARRRRPDKPSQTRCPAPGCSPLLAGCALLQVVSPTISSPVCQEQLIEAGKLVDRSVENCVRACQAATDDTELLKQVSAAASVVSQALNDLLQHVRQFASRGEPIGRYDQATDTIMYVTESIFSSMGDAGKHLDIF